MEFGLPTLARKLSIERQKNTRIRSKSSTGLLAPIEFLTPKWSIFCRRQHVIGKSHPLPKRQRLLTPQLSQQCDGTRQSDKQLQS
jgi:hypothetical protein